MQRIGAAKLVLADQKGPVQYHYSCCVLRAMIRIGNALIIGISQAKVDKHEVLVYKTCLLEKLHQHLVTGRFVQLIVFRWQIQFRRKD